MTREEFMKHAADAAYLGDTSALRVYAQQIFAERDEARSMLLDADSHIEELKYLNRKAQAEIEVLRGVGCREVKADEPESGPCGVCLKCAEERGAAWACLAVRRGDYDVYRDSFMAAKRICEEARERGGRR